MALGVFLAIAFLPAGPVGAETRPASVRAAGERQPPCVLIGNGFVRDSSHPLHPGDSRRFPITVKISAYLDADEFVVAVRDSGDSTGRPDLWYIRRGRVSRADTAGVETPDASLGDVRAEALAILHPAMMEGLDRFGRREHRAPYGQAEWKLGGSEVTTVDISGPGHMWLMDQQRTYFDERFGDQVEWVRDVPVHAADGVDSLDVSVERAGREVARFRFANAIVPGLVPDRVPPPGPERLDVEDHDAVHHLAPDQVHFTELAPHLFTVDLDSLNTRVTVAEFTDSLVVIEGAFGSGPCDVLARAVRERFHKPVRVFAFSHLHGEYSGGTRSWVHEGATIVVPPSTEPLIHQMVDASFASHPDALQREPRKLKLQTVPQHLHLEDSTNALDIYNVPSGHTDEYFLFHFPRQRVLLTGDLMFLRPGKPFGGRSKMLAQNVARLGLAVDTYVASWPLTGYGTKNIVTAAEFAQACADTAVGAAK